MKALAARVRGYWYAPTGLVWLAMVAATTSASAIVYSWARVSGTLSPGRQLPYVVSGGVGGLGLMVLGALAIRTGVASQLTIERHDELTSGASARASNATTVTLAAGAVLVVAGFVAIGLGWYGASGTLISGRQWPYVLSGGIGGLALIVLGTAVLDAGASRRRAHAEVDVLREILEASRAPEVTPSQRRRTEAS